MAANKMGSMLMVSQSQMKSRLSMGMGKGKKVQENTFTSCSLLTIIENLNFLIICMETCKNITV